MDTDLLQVTQFKTDRSVKQDALLSNEMSKGLNVNGCNNVNTSFHIIKVFPPAVTEPSVLGILLITSQSAGAQRVT